ncbi:MAG: hypothetical protein ACOX1A_09970 [Saccharofermentanales bacterium]
MKKLGDILIESGLLTEEQLQEALLKQRGSGHKLGETLVDMGLLSEIEIMKALEYQTRIPYVDMSGLRIDPTTPGLISEELQKNTVSSRSATKIINWFWL